MREILEAIEGEFARYKALAEGAFAQVDDSQLSESGPNDGNSLAIIVWHLSGNFASRYTNFLTADGEKPWRERDEEFLVRLVSRQELLEKWEAGWRVVSATLRDLQDADLGRVVHIRKQPMSVREALLRGLGHMSYHVGQIVYLAKSLRGPSWTYLSIPPGESSAYNAKPVAERGRDHASLLNARNAPNA